MFRFPRIKVRPTAGGFGYLALVLGITFGAINTGNNLIYMVLAVLLAGLLVSNVLAEWNLRGLKVERRLPAELFAGAAATGAYILTNPRRRGDAWAVEITEAAEGTGHGFVLHCPAGATVEVPATYVFADRGVARLERLWIGSRHPFGLLLRAREVDLAAEVLVYPATRRGAVAATPAGLGMDARSADRRADSGDFAGLREYQPGDPIRRIHWPTSARIGHPMVVQRTGEAGDQVVVRVDPASHGEAREEQIARATGQIEWHFARGDAVGLDADGEVLRPRSGATWRRHLLTTLALLPRRG